MLLSEFVLVVAPPVLLFVLLAEIGFIGVEEMTKLGGVVDELVVVELPIDELLP